MKATSNGPLGVEDSARKMASEVLDLNETMQAVAVLPGRPNTIHLREVPKPRLGDVPNGRGVLVKILRVGVDGTDKEINAAEYGAVPAGNDYLILGHESFGRVEAVGPNVTELKPGDYTLELKDEKVVIKKGKQMGEAPVKVETADSKYASTTVRYRNGDGKYRIQEIHLGGTNTKLIFAD